MPCRDQVAVFGQEGGTYQRLFARLLGQQAVAMIDLQTTGLNAVDRRRFVAEDVVEPEMGLYLPDDG